MKEKSYEYYTNDGGIIQTNRPSTIHTWRKRFSSNSSSSMLEELTEIVNSLKVLDEDDVVASDNDLKPKNVVLRSDIINLAKSHSPTEEQLQQANSSIERRASFSDVIRKQSTLLETFPIISPETPGVRRETIQHVNAWLLGSFEEDSNADL